MDTCKIALVYLDSSFQRGYSFSITCYYQPKSQFEGCMIGVKVQSMTQILSFGQAHLDPSRGNYSFMLFCTLI